MTQGTGVFTHQQDVVDMNALLGWLEGTNLRRVLGVSP